MWERANKPMTSNEKETLKAGCIGITALNVGIPGKLFFPGNVPPRGPAYSSLKRAQDAAKLKEADIKKNPSNYPKGAHVVIFSMRFWTKNSTEFQPDKYSRIDLTNYKYLAKPGFTNFDFGIYDKKTNLWWHANHCDGCANSQTGKPEPMSVYESDLSYYSKPLLDFNRQVFIPAVTTVNVPSSSNSSSTNKKQKP